MNIINSTVLRNNLADSLKTIIAIVNIDLFEDLLALANKDYIKSIKKARKEYEEGNVFSHDQVFGDV